MFNAGVPQRCAALKSSVPREESSFGSAKPLDAAVKNRQPNQAFSQKEKKQEHGCGTAHGADQSGPTFGSVDPLVGFEERNWIFHVAKIPQNRTMLYPKT